MEYIGTDAVSNRSLKFQYTIFFYTGNIVVKVGPGFRTTDQIILENLQYVFGVDAHTPAEINSIFDSILYEKGLLIATEATEKTKTKKNKTFLLRKIFYSYKRSCVIRTCADFIGFEVFQRGLTRYLNDQ